MPASRALVTPVGYSGEGEIQAAARREVLPDASWMQDLKAIATTDQSGASVATLEVAKVVRSVLAVTREVSNKLFELYQKGVTDGWPIPLMSALKSTVALLEDFADIDPLGKNLTGCDRRSAL